MNPFFISILRHCKGYVYNGHWPIRLNLRQYIKDHLHGHPSEDQLLRELAIVSDELIESEWKKLEQANN